MLYLRIGAALLAGGLLGFLTSGPAFAQSTTPTSSEAATANATSPGSAPSQPAGTTNPSSSSTPATEEQLPTMDVLEGLRSGKLAASAEGTGDGRMTIHLTNRTNRKLRVVLPPGLVATGATGQFGGMGMGGMGGGMGGMGMGGMGMMGGGMGGGMGMMGGMGGGMMGGGMGGMGGGMMGAA